MGNMKMYKYLIWDMDGTLVNTYRGIYNAYEHTFEKLCLKFQGDEFVRNVIGAPLKDVFTKVIGMCEEDAIYGMQIYRDYYEERGIFEVDEYPQIRELLAELSREGYHLSVGTLKREEFAKRIIKELDIAQYFSEVKGIDNNDRLTKKDIVNKCVELAGCHKREVILIGDSEYDEEGARLAGVDFLAVMYGYGFQKISPRYAIAQANSVGEVRTFFHRETMSSKDSY